MENYIFERVMIIDDTPIDRYVASYTMKKNHFAREIIEFDMATKAIDFLIENKNIPDNLPQIILLDIRMPEMDGFQFLEKLSSLPVPVCECCCIIMLTSSLDPTDQERAEKNKVVKKFINKPLDKAMLEELHQIYRQMSF